jgi:hypothetical protein
MMINDCVVFYLDIIFVDFGKVLLEILLLITFLFGCLFSFRFFD